MIGLSLTEDLVLEVLVARHRLGEPWWPFAPRHRQTLTRLTIKGLVEVDDDRVQLTELGRNTLLSPTWKPAAERVREAMAEDMLDSSGINWWIRQAQLHGVDPQVMLQVAEAAVASTRRWGRLLYEPDYPSLPRPLVDDLTAVAPSVICGETDLQALGATVKATGRRVLLLDRLGDTWTVYRDDDGEAAMAMLVRIEAEPLDHLNFAWIRGLCPMSVVGAPRRDIDALVNTAVLPAPYRPLHEALAEASGPEGPKMATLRALFALGYTSGD